MSKITNSPNEYSLNSSIYTDCLHAQTLMGANETFVRLCVRLNDRKRFYFYRNNNKRSSYQGTHSFASFSIFSPISFDYKYAFFCSFEFYHFCFKNRSFKSLFILFVSIFCFFLVTIVHYNNATINFR